MNHPTTKTIIWFTQSTNKLYTTTYHTKHNKPTNKQNERNKFDYAFSQTKIYIKKKKKNINCFQQTYKQQQPLCDD